VAEILAAYWAHAVEYYRKPDGSPSPEAGCLKSVLRPLRRLSDGLPAADFTSLKLRAVCGNAGRAILLEVRPARNSRSTHESTSTRRRRRRRQGRS